MLDQPPEVLDTPAPCDVPLQASPYSGMDPRLSAFLTTAFGDEIRVVQGPRGRHIVLRDDL